MMKVKIKKTEIYATPMNTGSAGKAIRPTSIADSYGMGRPTRTNPVGGYMAMQCFGASDNQKKSPTSKPGNGR